MMHPRHLLILEKDAQLCLTEEHRSEGADHYFTNTRLDCFLGQEALVNYYKVQNEAEAVKHFANLFFHQKQNSVVNACTFASGGQLSRNEFRVLLQEPHAACRIKGFYGLNADRQVMDHQIYVDHAAAHTQSVMDYRGVLAKQARAVFTGKVQVRAEAKKTQAQQFNHHVLLSPLAEVNTRPELEIDAAEVQCRHGATTGQLDEESLFYLCARGLDRSVAIMMLLEAFVETIVSEVNLPAWAQGLREAWGSYLARLA
jgi:Fe-S cluster assembly protein SufD